MSAATEDDKDLADNGFGPINVVVMRVLKFCLSVLQNAISVSLFFTPPCSIQIFRKAFSVTS